MELHEMTMMIKLERAQELQFEITEDPMKARSLGDELMTKLLEACEANPARRDEIIANGNAWLVDMVARFGGRRQWDLAEQFQYLLRRLNVEVGEVRAGYYD
ncbi:hypothetical protein ACSVHC_00060 [Arthrobacter sp. KNU-44]|uniref:hypothetical protein n=1 Tax=Arthrobacter sp. KNU-44 TaxID=3450744 RepID=UPI003F43E450